MTKKASAEVTRMAPAAIMRVALGVRYEPQYKVSDHIGAIIDSVLRANGTPFGPETFPLSQAQANEHVLVNAETGNKALRINQQDTILAWGLDTRNLEEVASLAHDFDKFVLGALREHAKVSQITRFGLATRIGFESGSLKHPPISKYLAGEFVQPSNLTSMRMRFTRRLAAEEALMKKDVNDFRQIIYTVEETEKGRVEIELDYQDHFKPFLDIGDWRDRPYSQFADQAVDQLEREFSGWVRSLIGVAEVA